MNVNVHITADERLLTIIDKFANTLLALNSNTAVQMTAAPQQATTTAVQEVAETKELLKVENEPHVAKKTMYFEHDGTGEIIKVAKGESLDFLDGPEIFDERTKADYEAQQAATQAEPPAENVASNDKPTVEENVVSEDVSDVPIPDAPTLRATAKKLMDAGKQAELKATLNSFTDVDGEPVQKLSGLQDADKAKFVAAVNALLGE